ncbi:hypothetical protein ACVWYS_000602 [Arthrobacter sp. TE12231]
MHSEQHKGPRGGGGNGSSCPEALGLPGPRCWARGHRLRQSIVPAPSENPRELFLQPLRAGVQVPGDALDGGRLITCGNSVHQFVVALMRQSIETDPPLLPEQIIVEDDTETDI